MTTPPRASAKNTMADGSHIRKSRIHNVHRRVKAKLVNQSHHLAKHGLKSHGKDGA